MRGGEGRRVGWEKGQDRQGGQGRAGQGRKGGKISDVIQYEVAETLSHTLLFSKTSPPLFSINNILGWLSPLHLRAQGTVARYAIQ